jgi:uncharacterized protein YlxW (UPF0749 family)
MKKHQFRHVLSFLILTLFIFATPADSQESTEQLTEEPNPTEQSSAEPDPLESQIDTLKEEIKRLKNNFNALEDPSDNAFKIFVIIAAFIALLSAFVIFWGIRLGRQQETLDNNQQQWQRKFNNSEQNWNGHLQLISQQNEERTQKLEEIESNQSLISNELKTFQNTIVSVESRLEELAQTVADLESDRETNITPDNAVVYQVDIESTVLEMQTRIEELARAYRNGEPIDLDYIEAPIPSHNVVLNINWIGRNITEWITELEQSTAANKDLIQTLKIAEQTIKDKLKTIRAESMPALKLINLETNMELGDLRDQSVIYSAQLEGVLIGYELGRKVDEVGSEQIIPQFIKNQLFNNVANHIPHDQLQEQLDRFLRLADYEIIPIEVGITEADSRVHDIQGSKQTGVKRGTVAEIIQPGLIQKTDRTIVQKPVVIRGE